MTASSDAGGIAAVEAKAGPALLVVGAAWVLLALAIPMFGLTTGTSIAILLGITLLLGGLSELVAAMASGTGWRPTHALLAVMLVAGGIVALAWPGPTVTVVSRIAAWALLALGIHALATAFSQRDAARAGTWWVPLVIGTFSLSIAFWASAQHRPSYTLAVLWVALTALVIGLTKFATKLRSAGGEEPRMDALTRSGFSGRATTEAARGQARGQRREEASGRGRM
ncbi:hypothetical protein CC117_01670 [Parafrankia colletiae]|uniref:HdeD family acid-resistance protein n=1 Tax=Parafrankia colletiae TaxID=573497 RepID=A0A1S1RHZ1_9ACTN|nr:DUF308 domain-containing protein [Parafrankia colletiae]OHV46373.1 hypothetical protein CC117_01670 [Parafrankia colletiae]